jgi:two-component system CheB/CheR fusion protein
MTHAAGDDWWANITLVLSQDAAGHPMLRTVLSDVGERKRMETMRLALSLRVEELSHSLVLGQEEARRRFSRELHDRTSPNLAALRINLDLITTATPAERASRAYADRIEDTRALLEDTTVSVRDICSELHPPVLDAGGLLSVVQNYVLQFSRRFGLQVHLHCPHGDMRLKPDLEISLFRILQEALTNCAKHASSTVVLVNLQLDVVPMLMSVHDNGIGFNPDSVELTAPGEKGGHGLRNMKETAEFVGGRFGLESVPGRGTRVFVEM